MTYLDIIKPIVIVLKKIWNNKQLIILKGTLFVQIKKLI